MLAYLSELWRFARLMPLLAGAAAYVLLAPNVDFAPDLAWHDGQRLAQLVVLSLAGLVVLMAALGHPTRQIWVSLPRWIRYALVTVLLLGLVSSVIAPLPRWALLEWSLLLLLGVLALAVAAAWQVSDAQREDVLVAVLYVTALVYSVKAVTMYFTMLVVGPDYGLGFKAEELFTGFSNVRFFSHVQTMLMPFLVLPLMWWGKTAARRMLLFVVPVLWWTLVITSFTRGSWVGLLIGALVAVVFGGRLAWRWIGWQIAALLAGAAVYVIFVFLVPDSLELLVPDSEGHPALLHRTTDVVSLRGRGELWAIAFDLIVNHPWLGIGPMHYAQHLSALGAHPHNAILQIMVEWGIPAAFLVTAVWVTAGLAWALHVRRVCQSAIVDRHALVLVALLAAITGASAQAMVDGIIVMPVSQMFLVLLCGWALGCYLNVTIDRSRFKSARTKGIAFRGVVFAALVALVWGLSPEVGRLEARMEEHLKLQPVGPNAKLLPRFWIQGLIGE